MISRLSMITVLLTLSSLSGCATQRTVASPQCPQEKPLTAALRVPGPAPILFEQCKTELLAQTSDQGLTPSCRQLDDWRRSTLIGKVDE